MTSVARRGELVEVTGTGDVAAVVTSVLARNQIVAEQPRVDQSSLEDAFVALTGHDSHRDGSKAREGER